LDTTTKHAFRTIGPFSVSTGHTADGSQATVEVTIRRDKLGQGNHAEDIQFELANLLVDALEKRTRKG